MKENLKDKQVSGKSYRFGIIGCGIIARKFADAISYNPSCQLIAVASKTPSKARKLANEFNVPKFCTYEEILNDSEIDVIYIATTHDTHFQIGKLSLEHGKHVVIEKPFTVNAIQADELISLSRKYNLFLMEAIWTRFLPSWKHLRTSVLDGLIGKPKFIDIAFGGIAGPEYIERLTRPDLAGGATLDLGIYPITFACYMLDEIPSEIKSMAHFSESGVDEISNYLFRYPSGSMVSIKASFNLFLVDEAIIYGTKGFIRYPNFQSGEKYSVSIHNDSNNIEHTHLIEIQNSSNGFIYQIEEVVKCISEGRIESEIIPLEETFEIMKTMDQIRNQWSFKYPFE